MTTSSGVESLREDSGRVKTKCVLGMTEKNKYLFLPAYPALPTRFRLFCLNRSRIRVGSVESEGLKTSFYFLVGGIGLSSVGYKAEVFAFGHDAVRV